MNDKRPLSFNDFTGQKNVVEQLRVACRAAQREGRSFPHTVFGGPPGLGKTTLAAIIANEMGGKLISRIATAIKTPNDIADTFTEIEEPETNYVIFIDEVEQLDRKLTEILHTVLEDKKITVSVNKAGPKEIDLSPFKFTFIVATNYLGELPRPFLDRFPLRLDMVPYNEEEIQQILERSAFKRRKLATRRGIEMIAKVSRGTPRIALSYFDRVYDYALAHEETWRVVQGVNSPIVDRLCVEKTMEMIGVDEHGLTELDRRIIKYLVQCGRTIGLGAIAEAVNEAESTVRLSEAFLIQRGLIVKTRSGRTVTPAGCSVINKTGVCS